MVNEWSFGFWIFPPLLTKCYVCIAQVGIWHGVIVIWKFGFLLKITVWKAKFLLWDHFCCLASNIAGSSNQINTLIGSTINFCFIPIFDSSVLHPSYVTSRMFQVWHWFTFIKSPWTKLQIISRSGQLVSSLNYIIQKNFRTNL